MTKPLLLTAAALLAVACTATDHHDASRATLERDLDRLTGVGENEQSSVHEPTTGGPLAADDAVRIALARNPDFRAEVLAAHEAALALDAVALGPTPMVMLEVGVPLSDMASVPVLALLTASLSDLVTREDRLEAASLRAQAAHLAAIDAASTLAATVRERHALAWQAQEGLRLSSERHALAQVEADRESTLASKGLAAVRRDQAALAMLASARAQLEQARAAHATSLRALAVAMGCGLEPAAWTISRPELPELPRGDVLATSMETPAARMALALSAATRIEAGLVRSGLAQNANIGAGYMQDEEGMKAIPITLQFALPIGGEGATRDERAALLEDAAELRAQAALQAAHVRLADAMDREAAARAAAEAIERTSLAAARAQLVRMRTLVEQGAATTKERDQLRQACIEAESQAVAAHVMACTVSAQRVAASAGIDLARESDDRRAER
ncbi:MAG: TolC family protein [Planctomycetes bacterium]|nr:TolC family protein [Planctomycetota bacterium]